MTDKNYGKLLASKDGKKLAVMLSNEPFIVAECSHAKLTNVFVSTPEEWQEATLRVIEDNFSMEILQSGISDDPFEGVDGVSWHTAVWLPNMEIAHLELTEPYNEPDWTIDLIVEEHNRVRVEKADYDKYCIITKPCVVM